MRRRLALVTACALIAVLMAPGADRIRPAAAANVEAALVLDPLPPQAWRDRWVQDAAIPLDQVTARRSQTDFTRISAEVTEAAWEVRLGNAGESAARVTVRESFGGEWLVVDENVKHRKDGPFTATWTVTVPAKGEVLLRYRARVKGCGYDPSISPMADCR